MNGYVSPARTRVLLAVIAVYERDGRATVPAVAAAAQRSVGNVHTRLLALRDMGLVTWEDNAAGTLRPTVSVAPFWRTGVRDSATLDENRSGGRAAANSVDPLPKTLTRRAPA